MRMRGCKFKHGLREWGTEGGQSVAMVGGANSLAPGIW